MVTAPGRTGNHDFPVQPLIPFIPSLKETHQPHAARQPPVTLEYPFQCSCFSTQSCQTSRRARSGRWYSPILIRLDIRILPQIIQHLLRPLPHAPCLKIYNRPIVRLEIVSGIEKSRTVFLNDFPVAPAGKDLAAEFGAFELASFYVVSVIALVSVSLSVRIYRLDRPVGTTDRSGSEILGGGGWRDSLKMTFIRLPYGPLPISRKLSISPSCQRSVLARPPGRAVEPAMRSARTF